MSGKKKQATKKATTASDYEPDVLPPGVTVGGFVENWNTSPTLKSFANGLGVSPSTAALYAARLRADGHALKQFPRGRPRRFKM